MILGISNLAFKEKSFRDVVRLIAQTPIKGIEIAPKVLWDDPVTTSKVQRKSVQDLCAEEGIKVIGLQALLFGHEELKIFDTDSLRLRCEDYVKQMIELCADLGGEFIVFGSWKNRKRDQMPFDKACAIAETFFLSLAHCAKDLGVQICLEPVSSGYGCDFLTTADESAQLVAKVNHPSFRLMLDTGSMWMNQEPCEEKIIKYANRIAHMHINDPFLSPPGAKGFDHRGIKAALEKVEYQGWLTFEFFPTGVTLEEDIKLALDCYDHKG
ncbi:MAG: sugar phosphate isomerase/epimerase [Candidatus Omnitrophica bacterium]|nr:sugar phosphate isomerase/epimerase [Candidatus Omnitrophota bacterium]